MATRKKRKAKTSTRSRSQSEPRPDTVTRDTEISPSMFERAAKLTTDALVAAAKTGEASLRWGASLLLDRPRLESLSAAQLEAMKQAGSLLHDVRETAGLTLEDLADALELSDTSLLAAVEDGTATLSFELIMRLSALVARHDPLPFVIRFARAYNPQLEQTLEDWGAAGLTRQWEREREFVNIYRRSDLARDLSDEEFRRLLDFVDSAFALATELVAEKQAANGKGS